MDLLYCINTTQSISGIKSNIYIGLWCKWKYIAMIVFCIIKCTTFGVIARGDRMDIVTKNDKYISAV